MKVAPKFYSKETLIKKLNKRNSNRINNYITVSESLAPEKAANVDQYADSLSRFAEKKGCILEFIPGKDLFKDSVQMNVYKKYLGIVHDKEGMPCFAFDGKSLSGQSIISEKNTEKTSAIDTIKNSIKNIIRNDKNWDNKFVDFH